MKHSILISGSSGYIGSHFVKYFHRAGYAVFGLDLVDAPHTLSTYLEDHLTADISDIDRLPSYLEENGIQGVVHCAAKCLVAESVEKPELYEDNNVRRSAIFADTLIAEGIQPIVFSSTAATYGEPKQVPIPESHPTNPINPYGQTKLHFENILRNHEKAGQLYVGIFRYFNAAGADPDTELGEHHDPESHLVPNAIRAALSGKAVSVFGTDYPTRDGTCERDYIHVWDLADAHLKLLERLLTGGKGGTYNLGTGKGYTVKEVLDEVDRQIGKPMKRDLKPRRPGDPAVLVADSSAAKKSLHWVPKHSDLPSIISTALAWHRRNTA